jgi:xanthine/uracil permease
MQEAVAEAPVARVRGFFRSLSSGGRIPDRKRPGALAYDVDEVPPHYLTLLLGCQHLVAMSVGWIYVVVTVSAMGASRADAQALLRVSMIASGITTILQARRGFLGSGYLCPASCSLTYLAPTILAGRMGGFPLIFGMTAVNGVFTAVLSRFLRVLRILFPPDVTGLIVSIVGIQLVAIGCPMLLGRSAASGAGESSSSFRSSLGLPWVLSPPFLWAFCRGRICEPSGRILCSAFPIVLRRE